MDRGDSRCNKRCFSELKRGGFLWKKTKKEEMEEEEVWRSDWGGGRVGKVLSSPDRSWTSFAWPPKTDHFSGGQKSLLIQILAAREPKVYQNLIWGFIDGWPAVGCGFWGDKHWLVCAKETSTDETARWLEATASPCCSPASQRSSKIRSRSKIITDEDRDTVQCSPTQSQI